VPARVALIGAFVLALWTTGRAQEIVKIPAGSAPTVARPDDLFDLPPGQWHFAKELWKDRLPCTQAQCEAGFTSGELVVSIEHANEHIRIMAGARGCPGIAYSEMETGLRPGKGTRKRVTKQVDVVLKGLRKSCHHDLPAVATFDAAMLFPNSQASGVASSP